MKSIPHDLYLKYLDHSILYEINKFHTKGNFSFDPQINHAIALHRHSNATLEMLTGNELRLYPEQPSSTSLNFNCNTNLTRNSSCDYFLPFHMEMEEIKELISPLLTKTADNHRRGHPSAGALYPIEVFICNLANECAQGLELPIHLLPCSRTFEKVLGADSPSLLRSLIPEGSTIGRPSIALIYIAYLPKTVFKYRYRGYRLALMEAGSMYMLMDLQCKDLGYVNRVWSAYSDYALTKALDLNPSLFLPLCVQFVGKS